MCLSDGLTRGQLVYKLEEALEAGLVEHVEFQEDTHCVSGDCDVMTNLREFMVQHLMSLSKVKTLTLSTCCKAKDANLSDFYDQFVGLLGCLARISVLRLEVQASSASQSRESLVEVFARVLR